MYPQPTFGWKRPSTLNTVSPFLTIHQPGGGAFTESLVMNSALENSHHAKHFWLLFCGFLYCSVLVHFFVAALSRLWDFSNFSTLPSTSPERSASDRQLAVPVNNSKRKKKKEKRIKKNGQHATSRICAVELLMIARLPRLCS